MYTGFKKLKLITHAGLQSKALRRPRLAKPKILERRKLPSVRMRSLTEVTRLRKGMMHLERTERMEFRRGRESKDRMAWVIGGRHWHINS
jgi:hypothetical protein